MVDPQSGDKAPNEPLCPCLSQLSSCFWLLFCTMCHRNPKQNQKVTRCKLHHSMLTLPCAQDQDLIWQQHLVLIYAHWEGLVRTGCLHHVSICANTSTAALLVLAENCL
eukprot:Skav204195  [mRNA]  locus=scaffold3425:58984:59344:+ [translate_table: standard]